MTRNGAPHVQLGAIPFVFANCMWGSEPILPTLTTSHLLYWFCLAVPQYSIAFCLGGDAILRSSALCTFQQRHYRPGNQVTRKIFSGSFEQYTPFPEISKALRFRQVCNVVNNLWLWLLDGVWIGWLDLVTPYTHQSELQAITALLLIATFYISLLHPLVSSVYYSLHNPCPVQRLLTQEL
jgi:hypothetical protein